MLTVPLGAVKQVRLVPMAGEAERRVSQQKGGSRDFRRFHCWDLRDVTCRVVSCRRLMLPTVL